MRCIGHSRATTIMCIACILISIVPIKTTHRRRRQLYSRINTEEEGEVIKTSGMVTSVLWPTNRTTGPVVRFFLAGKRGERPNATLLETVMKHVEGATCVTFEEQDPQLDCYDEVSEPTLCVSAEKDGDACFSDETGCRSGAEYDGEAQTLHMPRDSCPFHEGVQSLAKALGMLPEHRRRDREQTLQVMVTAAGTDRLLFAQGQTTPCSDYGDDSPLDLFSVTQFDTVAATLRHGASGGLLCLEPGMVFSVRNIRHQWILDYKQHRDLGLSFYDRRALNEAYGCAEQWGCTDQPDCANGGFRDLYCRCVCPLGFGGKTCESRTAPEDEDLLASNCSAMVRSYHAFSLAEIGLFNDGHRFYACDFTVVPPGCMRAQIHVNTSALRPLRVDTNPDLKDNNWCELYFTIMLKQSVRGWRTYCLDYFFNEETLVFMSRASINNTFGYIKLNIPRLETFSLVAQIFINITFVEVPECNEKGSAGEKGDAVVDHQHFTMVTAAFSYAAGLVLGIIGWMVVRGLCIGHEDQLSPDASLASSEESVASPPPPSCSPPPATGPQTLARPSPPEIRAPPPEIRAPPPEIRTPPPEIRAPSPEIRAPLPEIRAPPPEIRQAPPQPETRLPPIRAAELRPSPRQGGLRASFAHWGGAALHNLRASFGRGRPPQGESRPPPQGGVGLRPPQGGSRPSPQGDARPPQKTRRAPPRYKTTPSRPGGRGAPR